MVLDSGATAHLCCERKIFSEYKEHKERILLAGNNCIESVGRGTVIVKWHEFEIKLVDVLYVQELQYNFMSVEKGFCVKFSGASVIENDGTVILRTEKRENLFLFENAKNKCYNVQNKNSSQLCHYSDI